MKCFQKINSLTFFFLVMCLVSQVLQSQVSTIDASAGVLTQADSLKINLNKSKELCGDCVGDTNVILTLIEISSTLRAGNKYPEAIEFGEQAFQASVKANWKRGQAKSLMCIGRVYENNGNFAEAQNNYFKALALFEETENKAGVANARNSIGSIYSLNRNADEALKNYFIALKIHQELSDKNGISAVLSNIGRVYAFQGNYEEALKYHFADLKNRKEMKNTRNLVYTYNNLGYVYREMGKYEEALKYYKLFLDQVIENKGRLNVPYTKLGTIYYKLKKNQTAKKYLTDALAIVQVNPAKEPMKEIYGWLSSVDSAMGNYKDAYEHFKLFIVYRDSMFNEESAKKLVQSQMQYDFDKKSSADSIKNSEAKKFEEIKHGQEISKQKFFTYGGVIGFLIMIVVAGISFRAFKNKKKANVLIAHQKLLVEEKQKEILDSIYYARRIQRALITNEKYIERVLRNHNS